MAFKCEICKRRNAKHQYIGEAKRGDGEKELYICDPCFEFLNPTPSWKSLQKLLEYQYSISNSKTSWLSSMMTELTMAVLKTYHEIENTIIHDMPDFYEKQEGLYLSKMGELRDSHRMVFHRPEDEETVRRFEFTFDGNPVVFLISLDPNNKYRLVNMVSDKTKKKFPPAYDYVGIGLDHRADIVEFLRCIWYAWQIVEKMSDC